MDRAIPEDLLDLLGIGADLWQVLAQLGPRRSLPFPAILAASSNDSFLSLERARALALDWGAQLVDLGPCGHLNQASGHGPWVRGEALLSELR